MFPVSILYFAYTDLLSARQLRNKGLGSYMLEQLISSDHVKQEDFIIVWPAPTRDTNPEAYDETLEQPARTVLYDGVQTRQIKFYRKVAPILLASYNR
jgi:hypothetical protein